MYDNLCIPVTFDLSVKYSLCFFVQYHLCFSTAKSGYKLEYVFINLSLNTFAIILAAHISTTFPSHHIINIGSFFSSLNL
ncbi:hypothetical protein HOG21_03320 [bacterium]|nr:hypothetical protein [bacterium]